MDRFDYVIVGAGSAGCVLANRLSADGKHTVCLLEADPPDRNPYIHIPTGFMKLMDHKTLNWRYETEPSEWTGGRAIPVPRGKTLGGSSSINGNVYTRGNREDYNTWAQFGNKGWGYADVLPYFKRVALLAKFLIFHCVISSPTNDLQPVSTEAIYPISPLQWSFFPAREALPPAWPGKEEIFLTGE